MMKLSKLEKAIRKSWSLETTTNIKGWNSHNPSCGQCPGTSLVVNDYLDGDIVAAQAVIPKGKTLLHYYNMINGEPIDITRHQFPKGTTVEGEKYEINKVPIRDWMLSDPEVKKTYELLKKAVEDNL